MKRVRINQGRYIPLTFRLVGTAMVVIISIQVLGRLPEPLAIPLAILVSMILPMLWFTFHIITIDNESHELHDGVWLMGYRIGKPKSFDAIDKIYINKVNTAQNMNSRGSSYTARGTEYHAYIKLDDETTYFLLSNPDEQKLSEKVELIQKKLGMK